MPSPDVSAIAKLLPTLPGGQPADAPRPATNARPSVAKDRLTIRPREEDDKGQTPVKPAAVPYKYRITALFSFFTTALTSWIFDPNMFMRHVKTITSQVMRFTAGSRKVANWGVGLGAARQEGKVGKYVLEGIGATGKAAGSALNSLKTRALSFVGIGEPVAKAAATATVETVKNQGLIGWFNTFRAGGSTVPQALAQGVSRTLETGGDFPQIAAQATTMGSRWGQAFVTAGKIARLAPLLNVPIAIFDIIHARKAINNPDLTQRQRTAKLGQAYFSSAAAVLSVAAFLVPGPLDMLMLKLAGFAGFGSLGWSILSSDFMWRVYGRVGRFLGLNKG
jgi:hypothetical protein